MYHIDNELLQFVSGSQRNKVVFSDGAVEDIVYMDLGAVLSLRLRDCDLRNVRLEIVDIINDVFANNLQFSQSLGYYFAISNIGILFEPDLALNLEHIFSMFSRDRILFIDAKGSIADSDFCFYNTESGIKVSLAQLSYFSLY